MYSGLLGQNNVKDIALKYIELGGSSQEKLNILKDRIVESNPQQYKKDYSLGNPIYPIVDVKVLMPIKPLRKESPKDVFKKPDNRVTPAQNISKQSTSMYDAKRLGATIAPATYYEPPSSAKSYKPIPQPAGGKHIFYPSSHKGPASTVIAPPLTPQLPKNIYGKPPPPTRPSVISPVIGNTWETQKEQGRLSLTSPVPPPVPTVMAPSSASASMIKSTPPTLRGRILDQANFGIRAFKQDVRSPLRR